MMKPFFLSIRWKILIPLMASLLGAHLAIFCYINNTLVTQYDAARAQLNERNIKALEGSLSASFLKQLELAQTLSLVAESDAGAKLDRVQSLISVRYSYFETMGMLDTVAIYDAGGQLIEQWGDTAYRYDHLVLSALQYEYPVRKLHCNQSCYRYLAVPLLNEGKVSGVIILGRAVHDLVVDYKQLTGVDIGVAKFSQDNWQDVSDWAMDFSQLTQRNRNLQILNALSKQVPNFRFDTLYEIDAFDGRYEVYMTAPGRFDSDDSIWVLVSDATEHHKTLTSNQKLLAISLFSSFVGLGLVAYILSLRVKQRALAALQVDQAGLLTTNNDFIRDEFNVTTASLADLKLQVSQLSTEEKALDDRLEKALHALNMERELISALFDTSKSILMIQNMDGVVISGNACAETIFGKDALQGDKGFSDLLSMDQLLSRQAEEQLQRLYLGVQRMARFDTQMILDDGRIHHYSWINSIIETSHEVSIIVSLGIDITDKKKAEERLAWLAFTDPGVALANREVFLDKLPEEMEQARLEGRGMAMICLEVQGLHTTHNVFTEAESESVVNGIMLTISNVLRDDDMLARFSDDTYMIVLKGLKENKHAETVARKLIQGFSTPVTIGDHSVPLSIFMGISFYPDHALDVASFVSKAESAMFYAKQQGENSFVVHKEVPHSPSDDEPETTRLERFHDAVMKEQLGCCYEPVMSLTSHRSAGFSVSPCWSDLESEPLSEAEFDRLCEESGLQYRVNEQLIKYAIEEYPLWNSAIDTNLLLMLPIRIRQGQLNEMFHLVEQAFRQMPELTRYCVIELISDDIIKMEAGFEDLMARLHQLGLKISIRANDRVRPAMFIAHILPHDYMRVPVSMMQESDEEDQLKFKSMMRLADELGTVYIADGIKSSTCEAAVKEKGARLGIGPYYGEPMTLQSVQLFLQRP
jgi:diguanylate cyclase (GGDEF)-like protein/PAS domain S-box-containing protein